MIDVFSLLSVLTLGASWVIICALELYSQTEKWGKTWPWPVHNTANAHNAAGVYVT